jgi:prepilin peptidase CpaA
MLFLIAATAVAGVAAWTDLRSGTIPNWLTLGALAAGVAARTVVAWALVGGWRAGLASGGYAIAGALFCALVPGIMYWLGGAGGGDVKLFAALGALCQPVLGLEVVTYAFAAAAILAPIKLAYDGTLLKTLGRSLSLVVNPLRPRERREPVPAEAMTWFRMGPAIFLGAAASVASRWSWGALWTP